MGKRYHQRRLSTAMGCQRGIEFRAPGRLGTGVRAVERCGRCGKTMFEAHPVDADAATFEKASAADTSKPDYIEGTMAFMFETSQVLRPTQFALECPQLQPAYDACWASLPATFNPNRR